MLHSDTNDIHSENDNGGDADEEAPDNGSAIRVEAERAVARLRALSKRRPCVVLLGDSNAGKTTLARGAEHDHSEPAR